jgi:prepilin-type N-terminal cleavage/methylation domain-containing protein
MTTKQNKGFTLLEILLVIAAIGILAAIVLVAINPNRQIAQARNTVRQADINTIQKALEQYLIEKGSYPNGITNTYREICNTGSNNTTQGTVSSGCIDLRELVPDYIASISVNPSTSIHSGYYAWINDINNKVAVLAGKGENGKVIGVNHLKENIVTNGLVLNLDAGNPASYPGTGNTWFDLSGNNNNGTLVNGVGYDSFNGGSLSFDGVNDKVSFPNNTISTIAGMTVEVWFKTSSGTKYQDIFDLNDTFGVWIVTNYAPAGTGKINTSFNTTSGYMSANYSINSWYQVVLSGSGTSNFMFLNGVQVATETRTVASSINLNTARIGNVDGDRANEYLIGNVASLKIYNRALTPEEIQQNFNATRGRFGL